MVRRTTFGTPPVIWGTGGYYNYSSANPQPQQISFRITEFRRAAEQILVAEAHRITNVLGNAANAHVDHPLAGANGQYPEGVSLDPPHAGRWNYLFVDGHVDTLLPFDTIGSGTLSAPRGMWTRRIHAD
jgi:prepilin-type processing-associated H-X9-DG protein